MQGSLVENPGLVGIDVMAWSLLSFGTATWAGGQLRVQACHGELDDHLLTFLLLGQLDSWTASLG